MERLCQVGNKSPPNPQIPTKACPSFTFLGVEKVCNVSISGSGTTCFLPGQMISNTLWWCWSLNFLWAPCPCSPSQVSQQSLQGVLPQRQIFTCQQHIVNVMGPLYWCGEGQQEQILDCHPMTYGGAVQITPGKPLKCPLLPFPCESKLILWLGCQGFSDKGLC